VKRGCPETRRSSLHEERGCPEIRRSSLHVERGRPETRRSSLLVKRGCPEIRRSSLHEERGRPETRRSSLHVKRGCPEIRRSSLLVKRGCPETRRSSLHVERGCPETRRGSLHVKRGCPEIQPSQSGIAKFTFYVRFKRIRQRATFFSIPSSPHSVRLSRYLGCCDTMRAESLLYWVSQALFDGFAIKYCQKKEAFNHPITNFTALCTVKLGQNTDLTN
jgi:hypothetical protein